jgi:hypothetical protein
MIPGFVGCNKRRRCPICGRADWCLIASDSSVAICPRTPQGALRQMGEAGFVHVLDRDRHQANESARKYQPPPQPVIVNWEPRIESYERNLDRQSLESLAVSLRVRASSLAGLSIGFSHMHDAFTFPMRDANNVVIGVRLRNIRGEKWSVTSSRNGLFIPTLTAEWWSECPEVYVVEGPTDTAAMLDLQLPTIGRAGCNIGVPMACQFLRGKSVVIVSNYDEAKYRNDGSAFYPGQEGSAVLADALCGVAKEVRVIYPRKGKDVREWKRQGGGVEELLFIKNSAPQWVKKSVA